MLCHLFFASLLAFEPAFAQSSSLLDLDDTRPSSSTSEYVYRSTSKGNMVPVQVIGSVAKPGLYFVPPNTNLVRLLTLAGGPQSSANSERILVRKSDRSWDDVHVGGIAKTGASYRIDLEDVLKSPDHNALQMAANDTVFVPAKESFINSDVFRVVTFVSVIATTVLTAILIDQKTK